MARWRRRSIKAATSTSTSTFRRRHRDTYCCASAATRRWRGGPPARGSELLLLPIMRSRSAGSSQCAHRIQTYLLLRNIAGDEDHAAVAVLGGPGGDLDRWMGEVLRHLRGLSLRPVAR